MTFRGSSLHSVWLSGVVACAILSGNLVEGAPKKAPAKPKPPVQQRKVDIERLDPNLLTQAKISARQIDQLVKNNYAKYKITPHPKTDDSTFVRRAFLQISGAIPQYNRAKTFIFSSDPDKRQKLIDSLLNSPQSSGHLYNFFAELLRVKEELGPDIPGRSYGEWVREACEENKPYDEFVYEMLTAEGRVFDNPAAGYYLRDFNMPLDSLNNTVRLFLGTQIGCAQCHDHPTDKWTRKDFYQMAAFTTGITYSRGGRDKKFSPDGKKDVVSALREELKKIDPKYENGGRYNRLITSNLRDLHDVDRKLNFPRDYQYDDVKPNSPVTAKAIFDPQPVISAGTTPRQAMAKWMVSPENPRFAKSIANRMWKRAFGVGLIEPVDDMNDKTVAENEELMKFLTAEMIRLKFNLKEFNRIIYNTEVWQRECDSKEVVGGETYHFPGPILTRMSAEQIWDSFMTLATFPETRNNYHAEPAKVTTDLLKIDLPSVTAEEMMSLVDRYNKDLGPARSERNKEHKYNKFGQDVLLVLASELPAPMPPGHFLRQFGMSDRESLDGSNTEGSVPQVLQMFNGPLTHMLLEEKSYMFTVVNTGKTTSEKIDVIFMAVLNRKPSAAEKQAAIEEVKENGNPGIGNVIWALVNTREYLFIQ